MAPFSYARRAILWSNFMVPFNGAILWHVCIWLKYFLLLIQKPMNDSHFSQCFCMFGVPFDFSLPQE